MWALLLLLTQAGRPGPGLETLPRATVLVDSGVHQLVIQLPPVDVPAAGSGGEAMVAFPLCEVLVPVDASLHSARVEVVDGSGRPLPHEMLHHFNLSDPEHRELFLPIGLHLLAASKETPAITVPRLLFGLPLARGPQIQQHGELHTQESAHRGSGPRPERNLLRTSQNPGQGAAQDCANQNADQEAPPSEDTHSHTKRGPDPDRDRENSATR